MLRTAWFHEDDYCQVEVLPLENWDHCARQLGGIAEHSQAHRAPDGLGWTSVYVRSAEPLPLRAAGLRMEDVAAVLGPGLPAFDLVKTGYGQYAEDAPRTLAFGEESDQAIYFDHAEDGVVEHLWVVGLLPSMAGPLAAIGALTPLLLADWSFGNLIRLDDAAALTAYFGQGSGEE